MTEKIQNLIVKYLTREASISELDELSQWIDNNPMNRTEFKKFIQVDHAVNFNLKKFDAVNSKLQLIEFIEREKRTLRFRKFLNYTKYAAILIVLLGIGYFFNIGFLENKSPLINTNDGEPLVNNAEIIPGSDKATLTLEDGSTIELEKGKAIQTEKMKSNGQELVYNNSNVSGGEIKSNYLTIPRGGQFHVQLSDGTLVWLNSESQLKYPVSFIEGEPRIVELIYGEAYFEVSPSTEHKGSSFKVLNKSQEIEVLGTQFNIKAYKDETNIYTTLVEGKVAVSSSGSEQVLKPNQQLNLNLEDLSMSVMKVNVKYELAWRDGLFSFKGKSLEEIARVLSRWYDVEIQFLTPELKVVKFNGVLRKKDSIEEILNILINSNSIKAYEIESGRILIK